MLSLLRTPRWIAFTLIVAFLIVAFGLLSRWQWSRAEQHRLERIAIEQRAHLAPVPVDEALSPGTPPGVDLEWRPVTATGVFGPSTLVRKRPLDGHNGFWAFSALRTSTGTWLWVNRGWIAATGNASQSPAVPPAPLGEISISGRIRPSETAPVPQPSDLPAGQVTDADIAVFPEVDGAVYDAYVELYASTPNAQQGITALEPPQIDDNKNISYAIQWIAFAAVGIVGWFFFLRREARNGERETAQAN